jgi:hypothetical protein
MYVPTGLKDFRRDTLLPGSEKVRACCRPPATVSLGSPPRQEYLLKVIIYHAYAAAITAGVVVARSYRVSFLLAPHRTKPDLRRMKLPATLVLVSSVPRSRDPTPAMQRARRLEDGAAASTLLRP